MKNTVLVALCLLVLGAGPGLAQGETPNLPMPVLDLSLELDGGDCAPRSSVDAAPLEQPLLVPQSDPMSYEEPLPYGGYCYHDCSPCYTRYDCPFGSYYMSCTEQRLC